MKWTILFVMVAGVSSCAQILLKIGAEKADRRWICFQWQSLLGYMIYAAAAASTMFLYRYMDLSAGTLLETLGYVFVLFLAKVVLKEDITRKQYAGAAFILAGVALAVCGA